MELVNICIFLSHFTRLELINIIHLLDDVDVSGSYIVGRNMNPTIGIAALMSCVNDAVISITNCDIIIVVYTGISFNSSVNPTLEPKFPYQLQRLDICIESGPSSFYYHLHIQAFIWFNFVIFPIIVIAMLEISVAVSVAYKYKK